MDDNAIITFDIGNKKNIYKEKLKNIQLDKEI